MPYTSTIRTMLPSEVASLRRSARMSADHWAYVAGPVILGGFAAFFLGKALGAWISIPFLPQVLALVGCTAGVSLSIPICRAFSVAHTCLAKDASLETAEVLDVSDPVLVTQEEYEDEGPIYFLEIGQNKVLLLWGQWLLDPSILCGNPELRVTAEDEPELPFPCSRFRLHRCVESGRILYIEILGAPIAPVRELQSRAIPLSGLRDSELLDGTLDDLAGAVANQMPH